MKTVYLYDTTLRDGTQSEEVSLSVLDKVAIAEKLDEDANMKALVAAGTPVITVVGKSWDFHVIEALRTTLEENLQAVKDTVAYLKKNAGKVFFDAEHF